MKQIELKRGVGRTRLQESNEMTYTTKVRYQPPIMGEVEEVKEGLIKCNWEQCTDFCKKDCVHAGWHTMEE